MEQELQLKSQDERADMKSEKFKFFLDKILPWLVFSISFIALCLFIIFRIEYLLDPDMSSEQILADQMLKEGSLLFSKNWYYSTEIRVLNTQLVMIPLFMIFKNWLTVRIIGTILIYVLMILCFHYFCRKANLKKFFPYMCAILLTPFSDEYMKFALYYAQYIPYICLSFLVVGLIFDLIRSEKKWKKVMLAIFLGILSLFSGMTGIRELLVLHLPLLVGAVVLWIINHKKEDLKFETSFLKYSLISFGVSVVGLSINLFILPKFYKFNYYEAINFKNFTFERVESVIAGTLSGFGFNDTGSLLGTIVGNAFSVLFLIVFIIGLIKFFRNLNNYSKVQQTIVLFFVVGMALMTLVNIFTTLWYRVRYVIPITVFAIPTIFITYQGLNEYSLKLPFFKNLSMKIKQCMLVLLSLLFVANIGVTYRRYIKMDYTSNAKYVAEFLVENGYNTGYSCYWSYSTVLTELTDGKIDVYHWTGTLPNDFKNVDKIDRWLQRKDHFDNKPQGKIFVLFKKNEANNVELAKLFDKNKIIIEKGDIVVYGFSSYDELISIEGVEHL